MERVTSPYNIVILSLWTLPSTGKVVKVFHMSFTLNIQDKRQDYAIWIQSLTMLPAPSYFSVHWSYNNDLA